VRFPTFYHPRYRLLRTVVVWSTELTFEKNGSILRQSTGGTMRAFAILLIIGLIQVVQAETFTPPKGSVGFKEPRDGAAVTSPVKVVMESTVKLRPAGQDVNDHTTGHHHLLIDAGPIALGDVITTDETHLHFGKGQTDTQVTLKPGPHTLTLQLADGAHRSYGPTLSKTIHITVK
jgi:hypothetical protein